MTSPYFWRHFAVFVAGAACICMGLVPAIVAAAPGIILLGGGLLAAGGTRILEPKDPEK